MAGVAGQVARVRILGPVDVISASGEVHTSPSALRRTLLALLALRASDVVSADWLLEHAWGSEPPESGLRALRFHISHLRRELPDSAMIETRPAGYRLAVEREAVDALLMEAALRELRRKGSPAESVELLEGVVGLWRGQPFVDAAPCPYLDDEARRLGEVRLAVLCAYYAARIEAGDGADLIADLSRLVGDHPLQESLWASLITAQYRAGGQADALRSFEELRVVLAETAGLSPSPDLQALQARVLDQDPQLGDGAARSRSATQSVVNLPNPLTTFLGRSAEVIELAESLASARLVTVVGPGGAGKTRLAMEAARMVAPRFRDGVWFVDLAAVGDSTAVVATVATAIGVVAGDGATTDASRIVEVLRPQSALLLLDNCEHVIDAAAAVIDQLVSQCPNVHVLATSRQPLELPGEHVWVVETLSDDEAVALFGARARLADPSFAAPDEAVGELCRRLDNLPLALELAAARVRTFSIDDLLRRLDGSLSLLVGGRATPDRHRTVEAAILWSIALLSTDERALLAQMSLFPSSFTLDAAEAVAVSSGAVPLAAMVESLVLKSLLSTVVEEGRRRYRMLQLVRDLASRELAAAGDAITAPARFLEYVVDWARELRHGIEGPHPAGPIRELLRHESDLRAAHDVAVALGLPQRLVALVAATGPLGLIGAGAIAESPEWIREAASVADADPDEREIVLALEMGFGLDTDRVDAAYQELLGSSNHSIRASTEAHRGWTTAETDLDRGIEIISSGVEMLIERREVHHAAQMTAGLVNLLRRAGRIDDGFAALDRVERLHPGSIGLYGGVLEWDRGQLHLAQGEIDLARHWFERARSTADETESWIARWDAECGLGMIAQIESDWQLAADHLLRAHDAWLRVADSQDRIELALWAHAQVCLGNLAAAEDVMPEVERAASNMLVERFSAYYCLAFAAVARAHGNVALAAQNYQKVVQIMPDPAWWFGRVHAELALAEFAEQNGDPIAAAAHRARAEAARPRPPT